MNLKFLRSFVGLILLFASIIFLVENVNSWEKIFNAFDGKSQSCILLFYLCLAIATFLRAVRLFLVANKNIATSLKEVLIVFPKLFLIASAIPFKLGELSKIYWLHKKGADKYVSVSILFYLKIIDTIVLGGLAIIFYFSKIHSFYFPLFLILLVICIIVILVIKNIINKGFPKFKVKNRIFNRLGLNSNSLNLITDQNHIYLISLTSVIWSLLALGFYFVFASFFGEFSFRPSLLTLAVVNFSFIFAVTPGNIGIYQAAMVFALSKFGINETEGLAVSVFIFVLNITFTIIFGAISWFVNFKLFNQQISDD